MSALSVPAQSFSLTGETVEFHRTSESGSPVTTTHCKACGTRVCAQSAGNTALMNVFAATLDEIENYRPISNVYLCDAAAWIDPPEALFNFQKMPERPKR